MGKKPPSFRRPELTVFRTVSLKSSQSITRQMYYLLSQFSLNLTEAHSVKHKILFGLSYKKSYSTLMCQALWQNALYTFIHLIPIFLLAGLILQC